MNTVDIITILIALWGAIISSILIIREIKKEKKHILVFLDYITHYEVFQVRVVNTGQRPVTLMGVEMRTVSSKYDKLWLRKSRFYLLESFAAYSLQKNLNSEETIEFPHTLDYGKYIGFVVPNAMTEYLKYSFFPAFKNESMRGKIYIIDIEGKEYLAQVGQMINPKFQATIK